MEKRHQTARLTRGAHASPDEGVCVMELAADLADEGHTDRPRCVDPVIGAFLRAFNDRMGHKDRQRLLPYAARAVGTRGPSRLAKARRELCLRFAGVQSAARTRVALLVGVKPALVLDEGAGELAARAAVAEDDVESGLGLLEALIAEGEEPGRGAEVLEAAPLPGAVAVRA